MTLKNDGNTLIHFPSKPDLFEFDGDVAQVFDNMAERSIPMYEEGHKLHAYIAARWIRGQQEHRPPSANLHIMDIGASTGGFFYYLYQELGIPTSEPIVGVTLHASDISRPMLDKVNEKLPHVLTYEQGVIGLGSLGMKFDMVNFSYVLQFLKPVEMLTALREIRYCMHSHGLFFMSQKEKIVTGFEDTFQDRYIDFRKENGYSEEEIEAKTKALAGSMFPQSAPVLREMLSACEFDYVQETTRWLQFSTLVAIARRNDRSN